MRSSAGARFTASIVFFSDDKVNLVGYNDWTLNAILRYKG